jgi:hypothetical protein
MVISHEMVTGTESLAGFGLGRVVFKYAQLLVTLVELLYLTFFL